MWMKWRSSRSSWRDNICTSKLARLYPMGIALLYVTRALQGGAYYAHCRRQEVQNEHGKFQMPTANSTIILLDLIWVCVPSSSLLNLRVMGSRGQEWFFYLFALIDPKIQDGHSKTNRHLASPQTSVCTNMIWSMPLSGTEFHLSRSIIHNLVCLAVLFIRQLTSAPNSFVQLKSKWH